MTSPREPWRHDGSTDLSLYGRRGEREQADTGTARDRVVSTGLADRLAERRRALWALRRRRVRTGAAVLVVVAVVVWALLLSPLLGLRTSQVTVSGSDGSVSTQQVRDLLAGQEGTSLLRLDLREAGRTVTDALVRVRSTQVTRSWPHGLSVALTMRVPVAAHQVDRTWRVLDGDAVVLETVDAAPQGLVQVTDPEGAGLSGTQVAAVAQTVGALDVATRAQVVSGSASSSGQVSLVLASGAKVQWGDSQDLALKAQVLKVLLGQEASVYDVSSPHSPTTS
ncbi:cell division protein FtsQ/DivIB [Actinomyces faecalis]|uniref:cell division protein FtsQ/DivIB n=1 Tax=Actinomyces faecalis TaxID=2722820 RepID=UPI001FD43A78|nr:FtsQ-type POTRA domain-containing protein [Actinomyces faecalis]